MDSTRLTTSSIVHRPSSAALSGGPVPDELLAIIVAEGNSQRMGGADKQLRTIGGVPVLARTVAAFQSCEDVGAIVLVLNPDNMGAAAEMSGEYGWSKVRSMVA